MSPYELVQSEKAHFPVSLICEAVGVSRSAFYAWLRGTPSQRALTNERVLTEIRAIHREHHERYGSPRVRAELRDRGFDVGKHRVARLMRENGLRARLRRRRCQEFRVRDGFSFTPAAFQGNRSRVG